MCLLKIFILLESYWWLILREPCFKSLTLEIGVQDFPGDLEIKNPPCNAGNIGMIPGPGRFLHPEEQLSP